MNATVTSVPSSGIALDTSKAVKKPLTPQQREDKNRKLREKRAAAAQGKALDTTAGSSVRVFAPVPPPSPPVAPVLAQDALPKDLRPTDKGVKAKAKRALNALPRKAGKDKGGRRAIYGEPMHTVSFKCTKQQHATFLRAGGNVYLRARLDELTAYYAKGGK